jgi:hypothetical protein
MDPTRISPIDDTRRTDSAPASPGGVPIHVLAVRPREYSSSSSAGLAQVSTGDLRRAGRHYRRSLEADVFDEFPTPLAQKLKQHLARSLSAVEQELTRRDDVLPLDAA